MSGLRDPAPRLLLGGSLVTIVALGVLLRVWGAGQQLVLNDEIHAIDAVVNHDFRWIRTHFGAFDHSIPFALYAEFASHTFGLGEWALRWPGIAAGCLALVGVALASRRLLWPEAAVLCTGLFAFSPYLIFHSRQARPYMIVLLLFAIACALAFAWLHGGGRRRLVAAGTLFVLASWFHPIVLPSIGLLALCVLVAVARPPRRPGVWGDVAVASAVAGLLFVALLWPPLHDLVVQTSWKIDRGSFGIESFRGGLMFVHGLPIDPPLAVWALLTAAGVFLLWRRHPRETLWLSLLVGAQIAFIALRQPLMAEQTWVWVRYVTHLLPFAIAVVVAPLAWGLAELAKRTGREGLGVALAAAITVAFFGAHLAGDRYAFGASHAYNMHPWWMYVPADGPGSVQPPSAFYESPTAPGAAAGALIEAPLVIVIPLYGAYQRRHGLPVYSGITHSGWRQLLFVPQEGIDFQRVVDLENLDLAAVPDATLLVWHKQPEKEMYHAMIAASEGWPGKIHAPPRSRFLSFSEFEFFQVLPKLPEDIPRRFARIYDDAFIAVFDLRTPAAPGEDHTR